MIGHVYVLSGNGRVKIGRSVQPAVRAYQVGGRLEHASVEIPNSDTVERLAHKVLQAKGYRVGRSEWFDTTIEDAIGAVFLALEIAAGRAPEPVIARSARPSDLSEVIPLRLDDELYGRILAAQQRRGAAKPKIAQVIRELIRLGLEVDERRK